MSQLPIQQYLNHLQDLRRVSGTHRESVVREAFKDLLKGLGRGNDLTFIPEYEILTAAKDRRYVDGALLHALRMPFGYWEAKDEKDDLDAEIAFKTKRGYPQDNIIFEDSITAVLIQNGHEMTRCAVDDIASLEKLLHLFFGYERAEVAQFRKAVQQFRTDLPSVLASLRQMIDRAHVERDAFRVAMKDFLAHAREAINPNLTDADVREMLIQHILTEEIFSKVFDEDEFHRENNIAKALYELEATFFTGGLKKTTLRSLDPYYAAVRGAAAQIGSHREKQAFLKVIYENFYRIYNPKAADRLGVVYTPNEIVRFMIQGADWLCEKHFAKTLADRHVEILDPATGTGTFICELLEHFRGQPTKLRRKYAEELHANEVAILPYYVANLNIEATYAALTSEYMPFPNLCFVDTLDNIAGLRQNPGHQGDLFGSMSEENVSRIKRQNARKISVVIGNPPYNANQLNENENNRNREYPAIDRRIRDTYIKGSTAQKTKLYDMYARFFRWASDRIEENGIVAFISNRSFLDSRTFDGFRKVLQGEFHEVRVLDLGGDVRENPKLSGSKHNVFGIQTGVAISFLVKKPGSEGCRIHYSRRPELETASEKLSFLASSTLSDLQMEEIRPDPRNYWLNHTENDFDTLLPVASKQSKLAKSPTHENAIFKLFSLGVVTNRDDWNYDVDRKVLEAKVRLFTERYEAERRRWIKAGAPKDTAGWITRDIKWTSELEACLRRGTALAFDAAKVRLAAYRPFVRLWTYYDHVITHRVYQQDSIFPIGHDVSNECIVVTDPTAMKPWMVSVVKDLPDLHYVGAAAGTVCLPRRRFDGRESTDNITDWALRTFQEHYSANQRLGRSITKDAIFAYVYAVLHDPAYREKYASDLKRDLPRIPLYPDFRRWVKWGEELLKLHLEFAKAPQAKLRRMVSPCAKSGSRAGASAVTLRPDKDRGEILVDAETTLTGIPPEAWRYMLGSRSALEWILDQYRERTPKDPRVREVFDRYRFEDHKEAVVELLARVTTVSARTVAITSGMQKATR